MELDFLGAEQNLSVLAGSQPEYAVRFIGDDGKAIDLSDVTFDGAVTYPDGTVDPVDVTQDEADTTLLHLVFPVIDEVNSYAWELRAVSEDGAAMRIAYGKLGVLPTSLELEPQEPEETEVKMLDVHLPGKVQAHAMMEWRATTRAVMAADRARLSELAAKESADAAQASANEAQKAKEGIKEAIDEAIRTSTGNAKQYAENAKNSADAAEKSRQETEKKAKELVDELQGSAQQLAEDATSELREELEELRDNTEQTRKSADATVQKLEGFLAEFDDNVRSVVWVNPENDHLIIGGVDTGCKVTGDPGKSPYVDENGDWQYWDDDSQQWKNGGPARGEDGFSPYVNAEGYLVYRDPLTGEVRTGTDRMYGKDGLNGTQVRRIIVPSVDDLPQEGETCNGGFYYYIPLKDAPPIAIFVPKETRTKTGDVTINGQSVPLPAAELGATEASAAFAESLRAAFPAAVVEFDPESNAVILLDDVPYWLVKDLPPREWELTLHVRMKREGYDVYAWLEEQNGSASWVHVGEANDFATSEIYGLTKLGTDATIEGGAPVGTDENGQMHVPAADISQRGTVKLSIEGSIEDGVGGIGVDADGKIWTRRASRTTFGAAKLSYAGSGSTAPVVGMNDSGQLVVPFAGLNQAGVVRLGSYGGQTNPRPYNVSVGADVNQHLVNNLVYGGALQHMQPSGWVSKTMPWLDAVREEHPEYFTDLYYLGIVTSNQFTQDSKNGIMINSATTTLLSGVFLATDLQDARGNAVPSATLVRDWVHAECYTQTQIDEKELTLNNRIDTEVKTLNNRIDTEVRTLNNTITNKESALSNRIDTEVRTLNNTITNKESALSNRITANANKFGSYSTTSEMKNYVSGLLKNYATTSSMNNAFTSYYSKKEADQRYVKGESGLWSIGRYTDSDDIVTLSKKNPDKLYIKSQKKV